MIEDEDSKRDSSKDNNKLIVEFRNLIAKENKETGIKIN
jgi:hypothetical protein